MYLGQTGRAITASHEADMYWNEIVNLYGKMWNSYWTNSESGRDHQLRSLVELLNACHRYQSSVLEGARRLWTTFGKLSLGLGVAGTVMAVLFSAWAVSVYGHRKMPISRESSRLVYSLIRPETIVLGILCGGLFSDCFSMLEATVVRFTYASYIIFLTIATVARQKRKFCDPSERMAQSQGQDCDASQDPSLSRLSDVLLSIPLWRYTPLYVSNKFT